MSSTESARTCRAGATKGQIGNRGQALIVALAVVVGLTLVVASTQRLVVNELKLTRTEREYEHALQMAETGLNAYVNRLDYGATLVNPNDPNDARRLIPPLYEYPGGVAPSVGAFRQGVRSGTYALVRHPAGSQRGYFVGSIGTPGLTARFVAYGWSNGVARRLVAVARQASGDYALYGITSVEMHNNTTVTGNVGTNGAITMHNNNEVEQGFLVLNGPAASVSQHSNPGIRLRSGPDPYSWPTVDQIALGKWPNSGSTAPGGLGYLASHNDNNLALINGKAGIPANKVDLQNGATITFRGKPGGANYYVTDLTGKNQGTIRFDNVPGPVTVWLGPGGGTGRIEMKNGWDLVQTSTDPANACRVYIGTRGTSTIKNNGASAIGFYAYNFRNGQPIGSIELHNNSAFMNCQVIANTIQMQNNSTFIHVPAPYFYPNNNLYAITDWREFE